MNFIYKLTILFLFTSCATANYHLDLQMGAQTYTEDYSPHSIAQILSESTGSTVLILQGDDDMIVSSGQNFRIGISETTDKLFSKIAYTFTQYETITYKFDIDGNKLTSTTDFTTNGLYLALGWNFPYIKPFISIRDVQIKTTSTYSGDTTVIPNLSDSLSTNFLGWGVDLEFDLSENSKLYFHYTKETNQLYSPPIDIVDPSTNLTSYGIGFKYYIGTIKGLVDKKK